MLLPQAGPKVRVLAAGSTIAFSGNPGKARRVGDLATSQGSVENLNASARQGWIPWSRHTHRAVADSQMLGQQPRTPVCDTVFLRWRQRDQYRGCRGPGVRGRPERSSSDLTDPPSPERRTAGREVWSPSSCRPESPRRPGEGQAQKRSPTVPRTTCSAAAAHTLRSAPGCDRHWPIGRKTNASLIPSQSNRLRTHADKNHLMSETQRTAIDIARDHAHSQRDFSELRH